MGLNLIERTRAAAEGSSHVWRDIAALLQELAGEVERLWVIEKQLPVVCKNYSDEINRLQDAVAERDAEIERLKGLKDEQALAAASRAGFQHGYRIATSTLWPVVGTLLKDHHHGEEA